jgi:hypothetical protein
MLNWLKVHGCKISAKLFCTWSDVFFSYLFPEVYFSAWWLASHYFMRAVIKHNVVIAFLPNGGSDLQRNLKAGRLVKTKSSVLSWRVGKSTICSNPKSWDNSRNNWLTRCGYWCPVMVFDFQHISGRLKSPESIS